MSSAITVVLDIDGTLVDTNYQHAIAWHRALRDHGYIVQLWEIHRQIGMGGDQIVAALVGEEGEREDGDAIRKAEEEAYGELIGEVQAMHGATELLRELRDDGRGVDDLRRRRAHQAPPGPRPVLTGGFSEAELREAGAAHVCESIGELRKDRAVLVQLAAPGVQPVE